MGFKMIKKFVLAEVSEQHPFIKDIVAHLTKATKQSIAIVSVGKLLKTSGVATKAVDLSFEEGQVLTLVFRTDGDVIKTKLNNKTIPLITPMDYDDLTGFYSGLDSLALKLKSNQMKFNVKRRATRIVVPRTPKPSIKKQIEETRLYISEMEKINDDKRRLKEQKLKELSIALGDSVGGLA